MSAYDLTKMKGIFELVKISVPAVYKNIKRLHRDGLLTSIRQKGGTLPAKKLYSPTSKGENRFQELLRTCAASPVTFFFDFNVSLLFLNSVDRETGFHLISAVKTQLQNKKKYLKDQIEKHRELPFPAVNLAHQQLELCNVLLKWLTDFRVEFERVL
jgi:DNA-binding PadR family transcriptional regulator